MISSIQLNENVKVALDRMKTQSNETYEQVIVTMIHTVEEQKRKQEALMIEGCKEMAEENLKITREFEAIENVDEWVW